MEGRKKSPGAYNKMQGRADATSLNSPTSIERTATGCVALNTVCFPLKLLSMKIRLAAGCVFGYTKTFVGKP